MNYTNRHKLPFEVVEWLKFDEYDYNPNPKVLSATTLMKPLRIIVLEERWNNLITVDVSDLVASRYGTALHDSFEKCNIPNTIQEVRYYRDIDGFTVSGKVDLVKNSHLPVMTLADIKSTSVWNYILNKKDPTYTQQLSIYKWLMEDGYTLDKDGKKIEVKIKTEDEAKVVFLFTDWSKKDTMQKKDYPQSRVQEKVIPLDSLEDTEKFILGKLSEVKSARELSDNNLPLCSKEDLWQTDTTYAVKKKGAKRATKVYDSYAPAIKHAQSYKTNDYIVETRKGKVKRCNYCNVTEFCNQYKELLAHNLID